LEDSASGPHSVDDECVAGRLEFRIITPIKIRRSIARHLCYCAKCFSPRLQSIWPRPQWSDIRDSGSPDVDRSTGAIVHTSR
jgi:hypothetical protein